MTQGQNQKKRRGRGILLSVLCASVVSIGGGCRGDRSDEPPHQFFPDMDDAPKWKPQSQSEFFADGRTMRPKVPGTVPAARWGYHSAEFFAGDPSGAFAAIFDRADLLKDDESFYKGTAGAKPDGKPVFVKRIPTSVTVDAALLKRGQERFNIYCAVCHGYTGRADGMVASRWTGRSVVNLHDPKYSDPNEPDQKSADGFLFHTAMNGVPDPASAFPKMPGYSHALSERDAWAVVAYVRALRAAGNGTMDEVPADQRARLMDEKAKMPPPAPTGPTGATGAAGSTGAQGAGGTGGNR